ncbi:MAG: hypothetical protein EAX86_07170 [Candidatus Heimdallarchaeota archaeon]|nr:hypothetical protein [Candidatus Heimdallarchaeota archaeon]
MGLEDNVNEILRMTLKLKESIDRFGSSNLTEEFQASAHELQRQMLVITSILEDSKIDTSLQNSIKNLPTMISNLTEALNAIQRTFEKTTEETRNDLKFIKVSYVEDVVVSMRNLSNEITEIVKEAASTTKGQYEATVNNFVSILEQVKRIEDSLNALIQNQTDQLATVADLRDRVNAIIQVELASLRDRIAIYLEASVNELKTSVTERLVSQETAIKQLTLKTDQLINRVANLPEAMKQEMNAVIESEIKSELSETRKEVKKMTALIINAMKASEK